MNFIHINEFINELPLTVRTNIDQLITHLFN